MSLGQSLCCQKHVSVSNISHFCSPQAFDFHAALSQPLWFIRPSLCSAGGLGRGAKLWFPLFRARSPPSREHQPLRGPGEEQADQGRLATKQLCSPFPEARTANKMIGTNVGCPASSVPGPRAPSEEAAPSSTKSTGLRVRDPGSRPSSATS